GAQLVAGDPIRRVYLRDVWRYHSSDGWTKMPDLPQPVVAAPSPAPVIFDQILVLGGDDGTAVNLQSPARHPGFSRTVFSIDTTTGTCTKFGELPAPRVTAPCVRWGDAWVIPTGERQPGIRSPEVWSFKVAHEK